MFYAANRGTLRANANAGRGDRRFEFRWSWLPGDAWESTVSVLLEPAGYGTLLTLIDGPFDLRVPGVLDAYAEALEGWGEALAWLRGVVDFSSDLRSRPYRAPVARGAAGAAHPWRRVIVVVSLDGVPKYDGDLETHCQERHSPAGVAPDEQGR